MSTRACLSVRLVLSVLEVGVNWLNTAGTKISVKALYPKGRR